jgi:hypothetical protein
MPDGSTAVSDQLGTYGGTGHLPPAGYIAALRTDLTLLDFPIAARLDAGRTAGDFGGNVEDAVREFQIATGYPGLAQKHSNDVTVSILSRLTAAATPPP